MLRSVSIAFLLKTIGLGLWLLYSIVLSRLLSPEDFGLVFYCINFVMLAGPICALGYGGLILRSGSRCWADGRPEKLVTLLKLGRGRSLSAALCCFLGLLAISLAQIDNPIVADPSITVLSSFGVALYGFMIVQSAALRAAGFLTSSLIGMMISRSLVPIVGSIILSIWGYIDAYSALLVFIGGLATAVFFELWRLQYLCIDMSQVDRSDTVEYRSAARYLWVGDSANVLLQRADVLVVGFALGLHEVALYLVAQRLASLSTFCLDAIRIALGPSIARTYKGSNAAAFHQVIAKAAFLFFAFGIMGAGGVALLGWPALWLHSEEFTGAYSIVVILVIGHCSLAVMGPIGLVMSMTDLERVQGIVTTGAACMMVFLVWAGSGIAGTVGAAIGAAFAMWLNNGILCFVIWKQKSIFVGIMNREALLFFYPPTICRRVRTLFRCPSMNILR